MSPAAIGRLIKELEGNYQHRYLNGVLVSSELTKQIIVALTLFKRSKEES